MAQKVFLKPWCEKNYPELLDEWHPTKNDPSLLDTILKSSDDKVWWLGTCGHEWQSSPNSRTMKTRHGCRVCSGKDVLEGFNDLATLNPEAAKRWHPTKNGDIKPTMVTPKSMRTFWWRCPTCGYEWPSTVARLTTSTYMCSKCAGFPTSVPEKTIAHYISHYYTIKENYSLPSLGLRDLDIYLPSMKVGIEYDGGQFHHGSRDQEKNERCAKEGIVLIRVREKGLPCTKKCIEYYVKPGNYKELDETIIAILNYLKSIGGNNFDPGVINSKAVRNQILEQIASNFTTKSLANVNPELAKEWHPSFNGNLKPINFLPNSIDYVWWLCPKGHAYQATIHNRHQHKSGCPFCVNRKLIPGKNDLQTVFPELAKQWHPTKNEKKPSEVCFGTATPVWWICQKGHEWFVSPASRTIRYTESDKDDQLSGTKIRFTECPVCSNRQLQIGVNDLLTVLPEIAKQWHPTKNDLPPSEVKFSSGEKRWWICEKGHEWFVSPGSRLKRKGSDNKDDWKITGCPVCSNNVLLKGYNDLATRDPDLAKEWHPTLNEGVNPEDILYGSTIDRYWICKEGHHWKAKPVQRIKPRREGCPYCSSNKLWPGFNDLKTKHPDIAEMWDYSRNDTTPDQIFPNDSRMRYWYCPKGHLFKAPPNRLVNNRKHTKSSGCRYCRGFKDPSNYEVVNGRMRKKVPTKKIEDFL